MKTIEKKLEALKKPMPYKWREQSFSRYKPECTCVAYVDSRDVQDRLDEVFPGQWQDQYEEIKGNVYCRIGILIEDQWVWRTDCGTESNQDKEKGEASDAFKRAAVKWGIGRFLYSLGVKKLAANEKKDNNNRPFPVDDQGQRIWNVSEYINQKFDAKNQPATQKQLIRLGQLFNSGLLIPPEKQAAFDNAAETLESGALIKTGWAGAWIKFLKDLETDQSKIKATP